MAYGTLATIDTLASSQQTVAEFGEDNAFQAIDAALAAHNRIMDDLVATYAQRTTERLGRYGGLDTMHMDELDEYGRPDAQKITAGSNVGFPLRLFGGSLQWTRKYFQNTQAKELAAQVTGMMTADSRRFIYELKRALFLPTNVTFVDRLIDNVELPVKRLVNADSAPIPLGPNGETFTASSHTHYLGTGSFVAANLTSLINTIVEHFATGGVRVFINSAQEAAVRAFTGFTAYTDPRLINQTAGVIGAANLDMMNMNNRAIGIFGAAEVWVKPWVPASYVMAVHDGSAPVLAYRTRNGGGTLELVADDELHPLRARSWEREFGIAVQNRVGAAVLKTDNATYSAPTLTV